MLNRTLGHYEIVEKLGEGGMGEVYRARDQKLGRDVALKVLPQELAGDAGRRARFEREARAVAALKHPNIITLHSIEEIDGVHFITMEYVEGETLTTEIVEGGLPLDRFFALAVPLADALSSAHAKGIVHRDLKPANIMLDADGRPKILDFGLAKLFDSDRVVGETMVTEAGSATAEGSIVGTVAYMSPEQAEGGSVDARSDVFSLGIVLYEMATGRRPFKGKTSISTLSAILKDEPPSVTDLRPVAPRDLGRIISRCLAKEADRRFQTALDVRNELEHLHQETLTEERSSVVVSAPSVPSSDDPGKDRRQSRRSVATAAGLLVLLVVAFLFYRSGVFLDEGPSDSSLTDTTGDSRIMIVVLPFENLGAEGDTYFAAGMTDEVTSKLASVDGVGVISRKTATRYAETEKTIREIGEELNVDYVLEGTVRWARGEEAASRVRITPQLIRVSDDTNVWSDTYDRVFEDVFEVQSEIAREVIAQLGISLGGGTEGGDAARPTESIEAYQAYLRGVAAYSSGTAENYKLAVQMFRRAVEIDPNYAKAWGFLNRVQAFLQFGGDFSEPWCEQAKEALARAQALAPASPLTRLEQGYFYYYCERAFDRARPEFEAVVRERPNDAEALAALSFILRRMGEMDSHLEALTAALELDPQNLEYINDLGASYFGQRRFADADQMYARGIATAPDEISSYLHRSGNWLAWKGDLDGARAILAQAPGNETQYNIWASYDCYIGDCEAALDRLQLAPVSRPDERMGLIVHRGLIHLSLGQVDRGRALLEEAAVFFRLRLKEFPEAPLLHSTLGLIEAWLGNKDEAVRLGKRSVELLASDQFGGPSARVSLATIYAWVGEEDHAIDILEELLEPESVQAITRPMLRLQLEWTPLRDNPRFTALIN